MQELAEKFRLQPWQLLVPEVNVRQPPGLTVDNTAWPLPLVDRTAYYRLDGTARAFAQGAMANAINDQSRARPTLTSVPTTPAPAEATPDESAYGRARRDPPETTFIDHKQSSRPAATRKKGEGK